MCKVMSTGRRCLHLQERRAQQLQIPRASSCPTRDVGAHLYTLDNLERRAAVQTGLQRREGVNGFSIFLTVVHAGTKLQTALDGPLGAAHRDLVHVQGSDGPAASEQGLTCRQSGLNSYANFGR